jgi:hypothetical protein
MPHPFMDFQVFHVTLGFTQRGMCSPKNPDGLNRINKGKGKGSHDLDQNMGSQRIESMGDLRNMSEGQFMEFMKTCTEAEFVLFIRKLHQEFTQEFPDDWWTTEREDCLWTFLWGFEQQYPKSPEMTFQDHLMFGTICFWSTCKCMW